MTDCVNIRYDINALSSDLSDLKSDLSDLKERSDEKLSDLKERSDEKLSQLHEEMNDAFGHIRTAIEGILSRLDRIEAMTAQARTEVER